MTMSLFDVFILRKKLKKLNLWETVQLTDDAVAVLKRHMERLNTLDKLKKGEQNHLVTTEGLKTKPYPDQLAVAAYLLAMEKGGNFSEMGVGKSFGNLIVYHCLRHMKKVKHALIVCKNGGKGVWKDQITQHTNYTYTCVGNGSKEIEADLMNYYANPTDFLIVHYDCLSSRRPPKAGKNAPAVPSVAAQLLVNGHFDMIILDEAHKVKHTTTSRTQALLDITQTVGARYIIPTTGTPVAESPEDAYVILKLIKPQVLPSKSAFMKHFCIQRPLKVRNRQIWRTVGYQNLEDLQEIIEWVSFRKRQDEVIGMPEKVFHTTHAQMTAEQSRVYNAIEADVYDQIAAIPDNLMNLDIIAVKLIRLRQALSHPYLLGEKGESGKFLECDELLEEILADRHAKVVLWTEWPATAELLAHRYMERYGTCLIHGGVEIPLRDSIIQQYNHEAKPQVMVCTAEAAGDSLNLQRARQAIYIDRPIRLTAYKQSIDRIQRRNAVGSSIITSIVIPNSIDDWMTRQLTTKSDISEALTLRNEEIRSIDKQHLLKYLKNRTMKSGMNK